MWLSFFHYRTIVLARWVDSLHRIILYFQIGQTPNTAATNTFNNRLCYTILGLLGTYNGDPNDDLMNIDGTTVCVSGNTFTYSTTQMIYDQFTSRCKYMHWWCAIDNISYLQGSSMDETIGSDRWYFKIDISRFIIRYYSLDSDTYQTIGRSMCHWMRHSSLRSNKSNWRVWVWHNANTIIWWPDDVKWQ